MSIFSKGGFLEQFANAALSGATGGIMGQPKPAGSPNSTLSDILASIGYVGQQTTQGQKLLAETSGSYAGATFKNNWLWIAIIAVLGISLIMLKRKR
jgi:hypothetical protein